MYFTENSIPYYLLFIIYAILIYHGLNATTINYKIETISPQNKSRIGEFLNTMNIGKYHPDSEENLNLIDVIDKGYSTAAVAQNGTLLAVLLMSPGFVNRTSFKRLKTAIENRQLDHYYREELLKFHYQILESNHSLKLANQEESMHFHMAATLPAARRQGIMRKLFQHGTEIARQNGYELVTCVCENQDIKNLCLSLNWSCIHGPS